MRSGRLRHRVQIQQRSSAQDDFGQPVESWTTSATVWAAVEPINGREFIGKSSEIALASHRVVMRYVDGVTPASRIVFGARAFNVQHINNNRERNEYLEIICQEIAA